MTFLSYCQLHRLDPFSPDSKALHRAAQKAESKAKAAAARALATNPRGAWLRTLRALNTVYENAERSRAYLMREFSALTLSKDPATRALAVAEIGKAEAAVQEALDAYKAHGAEFPELLAEFDGRLELRDAQREIDSLLSRHAMLTAAAAIPPPQLPTPPPRLLELERLTATLRGRCQLLRETAAEAEQFYQAQEADGPRFKAGEALHAARARVLRAEGQSDDAERALARAREHHAKRTAILRARIEEHRSAAQEALVIADEILTTQRRIAALTAALPDPPRAPLHQINTRRIKPTARPDTQTADDLA